jgi:hypothetical protein
MFRFAMRLFDFIASAGYAQTWNVIRIDWYGDEPATGTEHALRTQEQMPRRRTNGFL